MCLYVGVRVSPCFVSCVLARVFNCVHVCVWGGGGVVGRGPPFAYWRKVGLQAYTWICSAATGIAGQSDCSVQVGPISG